MTMPSPYLIVFATFLINRCLVHAEVSPVNSISDEVKEIKEMVSSVQESLMASVRLIQDQVEQHDQDQFSKLDSRMAALEKSVAGVAAETKRIGERAHVWDTFQHHVTAWSELMTSMDSKIDHISQSQQEHQSTAIDHLSSLRQFQTDMSVQQSEKLDQIMSKGSDPLGEFTARGVLATLQDIELKVANISAKQHQQISRHRTSVQQKKHHATSQQNQCCNDVRYVVEDISSKVDVVYDHVVEAVADDYYVGNEAVGEEDKGEPMLIGSGTLPLRALRRTLKKSNRRISDMLNTESRRLTTALESFTDESDRRYSELFNLTMEMFEDQHRQMEKYEIRLAELSQCCLGTNSDVSGLRASISATLHSHAVEAAKVEEQRDERKRKQMRFDLDRVVAAVKEISDCGNVSTSEEKTDSESGALDSDRETSITRPEAAKRVHVKTEEGSGESSATTASVLEMKLTAQSMTTEAPIMSTTTTTTTTSTTTEATTAKPSQAKMRGCEDLMKNGYSESKVYTVKGDDEEEEEEAGDVAFAAGESYSARLCEQSASGGGWTVKKMNPTLLLVLSFLEMWLLRWVHE